MSNYTKSTNFATKDTLVSGNPSKIVKGTEIDTEFNAIASAIASKADTASPTFTGTPAVPTATAGSNTTQIANTAYVKAALEGIGGTIVQSVISQNGSYSATSATAFVPTGHTATITPTSTDSKILILVTGFMWQTNIYAFSGNVYSTIYRGATNLAGGTAGFTMTNVNTAASPGGASVYGSVAFSHLDSPSSTSSLTYQVYIRCEGGANAAWNGNGVGSIILLEIL